MRPVRKWVLALVVTVGMFMPLTALSPVRAAGQPGTPDIQPAAKKVKTGTGGRKTRKKDTRPALTPEQAQQLFKSMATQPDISFRFPSDGCYARAHLMVRRMQAMGYRPGKVWAFARSKQESLVCRTRNHPRGYVTWKYHVAPTIRVRIEDKVYDLVFDPSIFDHPVKISQWARAQKRSPTNRTPFICKTRIGQPPRRKPRARRTAGTGYWPSA